MPHRVYAALVLALLGFLGTTGRSQAALDWDRGEVMLTTGIVVLVLLAFLVAVYLVKHALGLDRMPPPEPDAGGHTHHD